MVSQHNYIQYHGHIMKTYGHIKHMGINTFKEAIMQRYKPENFMTEEEKEMRRKQEEAEQFVTTSKNKLVKIEMVGFEQA